MKIFRFDITVIRGIGRTTVRYQSLRLGFGESMYPSPCPKTYIFGPLRPHHFWLIKVRKRPYTFSPWPYNFRRWAYIDRLFSAKDWQSIYSIYSARTVYYPRPSIRLKWLWAGGRTPTGDRPELTQPNGSLSKNEQKSLTSFLWIINSIWYLNR